MGNYENIKYIYERYLYPVLIFAMLMSAFFFHRPANIFWDQQMHPVIFQSTVAIIGVAIYFAIWKFQYHFTITVLDICVYLFLAYNIVYGFIRSSFDYEPYSWAYISSLTIYTVIRFHHKVSGTGKKITYTFVVLFVINAIYCGFQLVRLIPLDHPSYRIQGLFANPGPLGCWIAAVCPLFLTFTKDSKRAKTFSRLLILCSLILILLSGSRTSLIAVVFSLAISSVLNGSWSGKINQYLKKIIPVGLGVLFLAASLFFINRESVNGRFFIWKIGMNMWLTDPLLGQGPGAVIANYNLFQEQYFASGLGTEKEKALAGTTYMVFNEPLRIVIENGIVGLVIFFLLVMLAFFYKNRSGSKISPAKASLLSILVFGLFSYPFNISAISCLFYVMLAQVSAEKPAVINNLDTRKTFGVLQIANIFIIVSLLTVGFSIRAWKAALTSWDYDEFSAIQQMNRCKKTLTNNGSFLFNFGSELCRRGYYKPGIQLLNSATYRLSNIYVYNQLGQAYAAANNPLMAEKVFRRSVNMYPSLFSARYALFKLYEKNCQPEKQAEIAKEIYHMPIKISNAESKEIKKEIANYLSINL